MKPLVLDLQAFMPYGTRQVIDFRALGTQRLMMIAGETGSGKTAILDAMAYGLFGASTGGARTEASYRSHHAEQGTFTYVNFRFELQGHCYRVVRFPPQKGKSQGAYELWRQTLVDDVEGELIASGKTKVNKAVQALLGYSLSQFRSVIMLPQGQFREFLAAKTEKKAEILSALFRTDRYQTLQDELYARFKRLEGEQADTRKQIAGILERAEVENELQLREAIDALKAEIELVGTTVNRLAESSAQLLKNHETQTRLLEKFEQLKTTQEALRTLEGHAAQRKADAERLRQAQLAAQVAPEETHLRTRREELETGKQRLRLATEAVETTQRVEEDARAKLTQETTRDEARDTLRRELVTLDALLEKLESIQGLVDSRDRLQEESQKAAAERTRATAELAANETEQTDLTKRLGEQRLLAASQGSAEARHRECSERLKRRRSLDDLQATVQAATETVERRRQAREAASVSVDAAKQNFERLYQAHLSAYAAQLAGHLEDGTPCPVCGSSDHPAPASTSGDAPDKATVETARDALLSAEAEEKQAQRALRAAESDREPKRASLDVVLEQLGDDATTGIDELEAAQTASQTTLATATRAAAEVPALEDALAKTRNAGQALTERAALSAANAEASDRAYRDAQTRVETQLSTVPETLQTLDAARAKREAQQTALQTLESALQSAQNAVSTASERAIQARTAKASEHAAVTAAETRCNEAEKTLAGRIAEAGFPDADAYRAARMEPDECTALDERIRTYDERLNRLRGQLEQLTAETEDRARPDVKASAEALAAAKAEEAEARDSLTAQQKTLSPKEQGLASIQTLKSQSADREAAFGRMATLAKTAQGDNGYRIKFERYVLAGLLDEVLVRASTRLRDMSRGRYTIRRAQLQSDGTKGTDGKRKLDRRSQAGLELEVVDAFTGRERDANTLSGGEGFQASLALALGLADVVQAQAGGIELSAMFIDEGFGTQSAEDLDSVLDTLVSLQDSGRLVGFISHVDGMKERISAKLVVTKTAQGSHARFVVQ